MAGSAPVNQNEIQPVEPGEKAEWRWKFSGEQVALEYAVEEGKLLKSALVSFDPKSKTYQLKTVELGTAKDQPIQREYVGETNGNKLVFDTPAKEGAEGRRITITRLNEKRTLVLFEQKGAGQNFFNRIAEVGYTREGTRLADSDQTGPECVVTGGAGTIKVSYKGETYWVCCTGCRDAFNDDPEGVLADYRKKREEQGREEISRPYRASSIGVNGNLLRLLFRSELCHANRRFDDSLPIVADVVGRPPLVGDVLGHSNRRQHLDGVPRADGQFVGVRLFSRNVDTDFAANAAFDIDFAEGLQDRDRLPRHLDDTVDRTDFEARFAAGAVVGVDDRDFLGELLARTRFGHDVQPV